MKKKPTTPAEEKIATDLEYRTPVSGKPSSVVVLSREQAEELLAILRELRGEIEELKKGGPT